MRVSPFRWASIAGAVARAGRLRERAARWRKRAASRRPERSRHGPTAAARPPRPALDPELEERILALDPRRGSARTTCEPLAAGPAPRIMLLHGGIYPVHLLMAIVRPLPRRHGLSRRRKIRDPGDGEWSYSPYDDSRELAGIVAWQYEHDGMRPMMIGHSQGGMQVVKMLRELAGQMSTSIPVWNPRHPQRRGAHDDRRSADRARSGPSSGLSLSYASAVGAGGAAFLLPNQWSMLGRLRSIPDTVDEFTGFFIGARHWLRGRVPGSESNRVPRERQGGGAQRRAARGVQPRHRSADGDLAARSADARSGSTPTRRVPTPTVVAADRGAAERAVGGRRLVQHQEALVPRGAAADPRAARRGIAVRPSAARRPGKIAVLPRRRTAVRSCVSPARFLAHDPLPSPERWRSSPARRAASAARSRCKLADGGARRRRQLLQQPRRSRGAVRRDPRARAAAPSRSRAASACRTASTRCSPSSASTSTASTSSSATPRRGVLKPAMEMTLKHWRWCLETNALARQPAGAARAAADEGRRAHHRACRASARQRAMPGYGFIGASKAALEALVRALAQELGPRGIRVNTVSAGVVDTDALALLSRIATSCSQNFAQRTPAGPVLDAGGRRRRRLPAVPARSRDDQRPHAGRRRRLRDLGLTR